MGTRDGHGLTDRIGGIRLLRDFSRAELIAAPLVFSVMFGAFYIGRDIRTTVLGSLLVFLVLLPGLIWLYRLAVRDLAVRRAVAGIAIRRGIERNEFRLVYQPISDFKTGRVVGAEALVRWQHPRHGFLDPAAFLSAVQGSRQAAAFDLHVLRMAAVDAAAWLAAGSRFFVAVNLFPRSLSEPLFADAVKRIIEETALPPTSLHLEVTEHTEFLEEDSAIATLEQLAALDVGLALDDFGTGLSSMQRLVRLPFTAVKLDRQFVAELLSDDRSRAVVRVGIGLAQALGITVVAEGVESEDVWHRLHSLGCEQFQGNLLSRGVAVTELPKIAERPISLALARRHPPDRRGAQHERRRGLADPRLQ